MMIVKTKTRKGAVWTRTVIEEKPKSFKEMEQKIFSELKLYDTDGADILKESIQEGISGIGDGESLTHTFTK